MVSAVFHSPLDAAAEAAAPRATPVAKPAAPLPAPAPVARAERPPREPFDWRELFMRVLPPVLGMALLIGQKY